ncbi:Choline/ethanolaminephosphotransferase [Myriangium duriaei CBS 260.36]|uniref:Choline/ethanolaminephosphotransferase n=1 Tax=Myriangium duriaei CBS 260.36 TaxID=1168546 RepID=A0A9P4J010_9PEZI|nr:Choline/ethanolaminephosphotransferase [Myriangium duriaei CBS 260.36]
MNPCNLARLKCWPDLYTEEAAHECVSEDALIHLRSYQYSSVDKSFISRYILKHYWNAFVELLPLWLAPNMVTLLGFFFILGNVGLLQLFDPGLTGEGPRWLYVSYAIGIWMYSTMDNVDGKQARRTGTSSGLGELFDHGIDSLNCTLASLLEASAMGLGTTPAGVFTALIPTLPMFFSTWETYHTHTLFLGYFNGPTEGLILATVIMLLSAFYGPGLWRAPLANLFGFEKILGKLSMVDIWIPLLLVSFFVAHLPDCVMNVYRARKERGQSIAPLFKEWTPMVVFCSALLLWIGSPESHIMSHNYITLLCLTLSFVFGRMTTKIILAHLTRQDFPYWTMMLAPLIGGAALTNLRFLGLKPIGPTTEYYYLWGCFIFSGIVYFRWAVLVINAICDFLGINCLTIPPEKWEAAKDRAKHS